MTFTYNQKLQIQEATIKQVWFRSQVELPKGWSIDHRYNEVVYRNLIETLRYDLGIWIGERGVVTVSSLRKRCAEIISASKSEVAAAEKAQDEKYKEYWDQQQ